MCQCAERRTMIVQAAQGVASGQFAPVAQAATFVAQSLAQDAAAAVSAARLRLAARVGRR